jgi:AraC family transcriptional regulator
MPIQRTPFLVGETHGILSRPENAVRASSDRFGWTSLYASMQRELPYEGVFPGVKDQLIVQHLDGPVTIDRLNGSSAERCLVPAGGLHLFPGGLEFGVRLMGVLSTLHVYVRREVIEEVAAELSDRDPAHVEIAPQFLAPDPALDSLFGAIRHALSEDEYGSAIYIDYLSRAIASHLVHHHSGTRVKMAPSTARTLVSPLLRTAVDYMRTNIEQPIGLDDIADVVGRSPSQVARQFHAGFGVPPHRYLLIMRIKHAQHLLATTGQTIAEIALACGFSHQEHMARVFRRWCDTTPAAYRRATRN